MTLVQATPSDLDITRRPWGTWQVLDTGEGFKVKQITVAPHHRLSLQTHVHRSEHWIIGAGRATCTVARRRFTAGVGERVDVPLGCAHRIENESDDELIVIEVQLGAYTGEDDIIRLADDYGR